MERKELKMFTRLLERMLDDIKEAKQDGNIYPLFPKELDNIILNIKGLLKKSYLFLTDEIKYEFPYIVNPDCLECRYLDYMPEEDCEKYDCGKPESFECKIRETYKK